jgi:cell shape-determining protein MreD
MFGVLRISPAMIAFHTLLILVAALLAVFAQAAFDGLRDWLGAQVDLLPALMVYAALQTNLTTIVLVAMAGGLCFDALSANPLGATMLPLFAVGLVLHSRRGLILRDQAFAQFVLGVIASGTVPGLTVLILLSLGATPLVGWGSGWQLLVVGLGGGLLTPVVFQFFHLCLRTLSYRSATQTSFRPDRDIRRGRF